MKNVDAVIKFYEQVKFNAQFDYLALAGQFKEHDIFANPPQFHSVTLPFLGAIELGLAALKEPDYPNKDISHCKVAPDDGEYRYSSRVSFLAKETQALASVGYEVCKYNDFAGLIELSCNQSSHSTLFGHPAQYFGGGHWPKRTPEEFVTNLLPGLVDNVIKRFYPKELHEYPFDEGERVTVYVRDVNKNGGYTKHTTAEEAIGLFHSMANGIVTQERGNTYATGCIRSGGVMFVFPAFGKNYVAFANG